MRLADRATVIRSKNAKPFVLTFDVLFADANDYWAVIDSGAISPQKIAELYSVPAETTKVIEYPAALAIKATIPRWVPAASFEDRDVLGAQQAIPLYDIEVPDR